MCPLNRGMNNEEQEKRVTIEKSILVRTSVISESGD
jgi:hypothetical protein